MPATATRSVEKPPGTLRRYFNAQDACWHVQLTQGETYVTAEADELLTTILGSCVAACIRDPIAGVGGMNHFLLPEGSSDDKNADRYGVNAMELLINGLLKQGASRHRLEAKLFGGGNVLAGLSDVGTRNAAFAQKYLADECIPVVGGDMGGKAPRRIQFWPQSGRARQLSLHITDTESLLQAERNRAQQLRAQPQENGNDVELF